MSKHYNTIRKTSLPRFLKSKPDDLVYNLRSVTGSPHNIIYDGEIDTLPTAIDCTISTSSDRYVLSFPGNS